MEEFRKIKSLGKGGMGEVILVARERGQFRRLYAIKRLHAEFAQQELYRDMFLNEARIAGLLRHANIVSVQDVGEDDKGPYLMMDFVEGLTVGDLLGSMKNVPILLALMIVERTARGLHAVHTLRAENGDELKVIHRDVSPHNILLGYDGAVRLADFGVAKALDAAEETGTVKGKTGYMSPEQLRSEPLDQRSDLFGLGTVLFELLSGRRLYRAETPAETADLILNDPPPDIVEERDDVPPQLVQLLFSLLAKSPESRPKSALSVAETLADAISDLHGELGAFDIAEFMRSSFADRREALRAEIADALDEKYDAKTQQFLLAKKVIEKWDAESSTQDPYADPTTIDVGVKTTQYAYTDQTALDVAETTELIAKTAPQTDPRLYRGAALLCLGALLLGGFGYWKWAREVPEEMVARPLLRAPAVSVPVSAEVPPPVDKVKVPSNTIVVSTEPKDVEAAPRVEESNDTPEPANKQRVVRIHPVPRSSLMSKTSSRRTMKQSKTKKPVWSAVPPPEFRWMKPKKTPK